jgi:hypothetical protein
VATTAIAGTAGIEDRYDKLVQSVTVASGYLNHGMGTQAMNTSIKAYRGLVPSVILLGCGVAHEPERAERLDEVASTAAAPGDAVTSSPGLTLTFPRGVPLSAVFLSASDRLQIDDRVTLGQSGQLPMVAGLGPSGAELGSGVQAFTNVTSGASLFLRSAAHIRGSVTAAGAITKQRADVVIDGQTVSNTPVSSQTTSFDVVFPGTTGGPVTVGPEGPLVSLTPGAYGSLDVRSRGKISLTTGTYYFDSFNTEPQGEIQLNGAPIYLYVKNAFTYKGGFRRISGDDGQILVGYFGTTDAFLQAPFVGTIIAPNATVAMHRPESGQHRGTFFGKTIEVFSDLQVAFLAFNFSVGCAFGDSDQDGVSDCDDRCPRDPSKTRPGTCGCGTPDTDRDGDHVADCKDGCPDDASAQRAGTCGCPSHPAPSGTPCGDGICAGAHSCNGSGQCGDAAECRPATGCVPRSFDGKWYWFCPGPTTFDQAAAACRSVQTALVQVDGDAENAFLSGNLSTSAWIGANDRAVEGRWRWASVASDQGDRFWDGGADGLRYFTRYSAWASASPVAGGEDCASLSGNGTWINTSCSASAGFICEVNDHGSGYHLPHDPPCTILGTSCAPVVPEPACQGDPSAEEAALFDNLTQDQTVALFQACNDACKDGKQDTQACADACTGPATPPPPGSVCPEVKEADTHACTLKQKLSILGIDFPCTADSDCLLGTVCGVFYPCDPADRTNKTSTCFAANAAPTVPGVPSSGRVCGFPSDGCPQLSDDFPAPCQEVSDCKVDHAQTTTNANGAGADLTEQAFDAEATFGPPPTVNADTAFPDDSHPCGANDCPTTPDHPWCKLGLQPGDAVPAKAPEAPQKHGRGDGDAVSFDFDPKLTFEHEASLSAFGIPTLNLAAHAGFSADVIYHIAGDGSISVIDVEAGLAATECGIQGDLTFSIFGEDFIPVLEAVADHDLPLPLAVPARDAQQTCRKALDDFQTAANRAKKAFRDATDLLRQYHEAIKDDVPGDATTTANNFSQLLCGNLVNERPRGFPPGDCKTEAPEDTINRFITYYERTVTGFAGLDRAKGLQELAGELVDKIPDIEFPAANNGPFRLFSIGRDEQVTVAQFTFFIGPIPVNLEIISTAGYGADITAHMVLKPGSVVAAMLPFSQGSAAQDIAFVEVGGEPHAGVGLGLFVGVGFSVLGVTAKVGIESDLNLGDVWVPVTAGAGITLGTELDHRKLSSDLDDVTSGQELLPTKRYVVGLRYSAQIRAAIRDILSGSVLAKLKLKFVFFSKTWRKTLLQFTGFCHGDPNVALDGCDLNLLSLAGTADIASGSLPWGSLRQEMPFPKLTRLTTHAPTGESGPRTSVAGKYFFDSLCTCIDGEDPADDRECFRGDDCCPNKPRCFHPPDGGKAQCIDCLANDERCNVDSDCCSQLCNTTTGTCVSPGGCGTTCTRKAECIATDFCSSDHQCLDSHNCIPR